MTPPYVGCYAKRSFIKACWGKYGFAEIGGETYPLPPGDREGRPYAGVQT